MNYTNLKYIIYRSMFIFRYHHLTIYCYNSRQDYLADCKSMENYAQKVGF